MPSIANLKSRDEKKKLLYYYEQGYKSADEMVQVKKQHYEDKKQEYKAWCDQNSLDYDLKE